MRAAGAARVGARGFGSVGFGRPYNRFGRGYLRRRGFVIPIWWGGAFCYWDTTDPYDCYPDYSEDDQTAYGYASYPAPIIIQLPPTVPVQPPVNPSRNQETQASPPQENLPPLTLVLRDGQVLEAAAFTITNDQVTYVTAEGMRRSFPVRELDEHATREKNEEQGTMIALPD
jgi:hypothetical protein